MSPKETLRGEIKNRLKNVSGEEFHFQGTGAAVLLRNSTIWSRYKTIFLFLSTNSEIDTCLLFEAALKEGKKIFAPRVESDTKSGKKLVFHLLLSCDGPWQEGPFGIREPRGGRSPEAGDFPALILAPGIAFDREGNRLGHGKGYYDRFFSELETENRQYTALGLCMNFQLVNRVPVGDKDKKVNGFLTGEELVILK